MGPEWVGDKFWWGPQGKMACNYTADNNLGDRLVP